jgi:glycosyltransferase involved in cell wall biosynthesis
MKKIKIGIISPISWRTPPRKYGPWEQVASNIAEGMIRYGHDVTLFATGDSATKGKLVSVCPRPVEEDKSLDSEVYKFLHLSKVFEYADSFDIIHNQFDYYPLVFSPFIKTPMVTTINGFHHQQYKKIYQKFDKQVHYVSISDSNRAKELSYAATVYNGIDMEEFEFDDKSKRDYLLFIGRISRDKGTDRAIKIAKSVDIPLVIAGQVPPEEKEYFSKLVKPQIDGKFIKWIGPVDSLGRKKVFSQAIASLHMINFDEPFGLTVAEAMASGVPVIAINRGSMPELITNDVDGFLVKNDQEAIRAIAKIDMIDRVKCRQKVKNNFTIEKMTQGYLNVYQEVLNNKNI